jgi:hypothetical protein
MDEDKDLIERVSVLRLQPGDILAVHCGSLTMEQVERLTQKLRQFLRSKEIYGVDVMVLQGVNQFSVIRSEHGDPV